jgi:glycosyltransferase involved in cell wall biosynthesis
VLSRPGRPQAAIYVAAVRVLLVSFYFPPAGGGGVQRPLKLATHLPEHGIAVDVLAPTDPRWVHRDEECALPGRVRVHRCAYLGPRGRWPAEELHRLRGPRRALRRLSLLPRRLLIPDENAPWLLTAIPAALAIARRERIEAVVTTSPPTSVHLVGLVVARTLGIPWVADLRDSIVAKPDRRFESSLVRLKERTHAWVQRLVVRHAAAIVAVTPTIAAQIETLKPRGRVVVIPNGADFEDFEGLPYRASPKFRITHTGSFFGQRSPRPFLEALARTNGDVVARFVGDFRAADREWAEQLGLGDKLEVVPFLPHRRALELQRDSEALLLLLPEVGERGKDVPSGKVFEYLAAERPILALVPPDGAAAELIRRTRSGVVVAPDDADGVRQALEELIGRWRDGGLEVPQLEPAQREELSRLTRVRELAELLRSVQR